MMLIRNSFITAIVLIFATNCANARPWFAEPSANFSVGFDDNPALAMDTDSDTVGVTSVFDEADEQGFALIGGDIRFGSETGSDLIAFDLGVEARRFNESEFNSEFVGISAIYEKSGIDNDFSLEAGFLKDSILETELGDTGRFEENVDRDEAFIGTALTRRFSQLWSGDFLLGYSDVSFNSNTGEFTNFEEFTTSAQLNRVITERLSTFGLIDFISFRPTDPTSVGETEKDDFTSLQLGINYNLTEQLAILLSAGQGFIDTDQTVENGVVNFSGDNTVYSLRLDYTGERNAVGAEFSNTFDSSADGGLSETQRFSLSLSRPESLGGIFSISATYISREPVRGETESRDYYELVPEIRWEINRNFSITAEVSYREQEVVDTGTNLTERADSTSATVGLRYDFGRKRISY